MQFRNDQVHQHRQIARSIEQRANVVQTRLCPLKPSGHQYVISTGPAYATRYCTGVQLQPFQFSLRTFQHSVTARANVVTVTIVSARVLHAKVQPREVSTTAFVVCRCCNVPGPLAETLVLVDGKRNEALCAHCCFLQAAAAGSRVKWHWGPGSARTCSWQRSKLSTHPNMHG